MEQLRSQPNNSFHDVIEGLRILEEQGPGKPLPEAVLTDEDWQSYYAELESHREIYTLDPKDRTIRLR